MAYVYLYVYVYVCVYVGASRLVGQQEWSAHTGPVRASKRGEGKTKNQRLYARKICVCMCVLRGRWVSVLCECVRAISSASSFLRGGVSSSSCVGWAGG